MPASTVAPSSPWDVWRFVAIEPVDLSEGTYTIASQVFEGSTDVYLAEASVTMQTGILWVTGLYAEGATPQYPSIEYTEERSFFGPNILFTLP